MTTQWNHRLFMSRDQIQKYDRIAIDDFGIPGAVLMETAGKGAADIAANMLTPKDSVAIVAGPGNNGGDGFSVARHLCNAGHPTTVWLAVNETAIQNDARLYFDIIKKMKIPIHSIENDADVAALIQHLEKTTLIVDALLGTGVNRPVQGIMSTIIDAMNQTPSPILSLDIPSGLDATTGAPWGPTVRATATATFGHYKSGLLLYPGAEYAADIHVIPIGVPRNASTDAGTTGEIITEETMRPLFPKRTPDSHKGTFGHLAIVGGAPGTTGAAVMAAQAALRCGTGRVTIGTTQDTRQTIEQQVVETMVTSILTHPDTQPDRHDRERLAALMESKDALALGPGLSTAPGSTQVTLDLLKRGTCPIVVDADALFVLAANPTAATDTDRPLVLTPHPKELARLTGQSVADIQADRIGIAKNTARRYNAVVVLKGAHTVIASPPGAVFINLTGNHGMGTAGSGDVLTGIIGGFLAQGLPPLAAACLGTWVHGTAGDITAAKTGPRALIATDIIAALPEVFCRWDAP